MSRLLMTATLATAAAFLASPAARADEWSKTYPIAARADLVVQTDDGSVTISSTDQKQISAHVVTEGYKIGPGDVRIEESQSGDHVSLSVKAPHLPSFSLSRRSIRVELRVPRELDLDASTGDGAVDVQTISGHIRIRTGDGSIHATSLHGDVFLHSGDGGIDAGGADGILKAESGDGSIHLSGRFDNLDLHTGDGGIDATATAGSKVAGIWSLHSGDGSVKLRIPRDFRADLDLKTGDGGITVDLPVATQGAVQRSRLLGSINGGGGLLKIDTGDGSIHLMGL